ASLTVNGRRQGYDHIPMPRMTNTFMMSGQSTAEEIIRPGKKLLYADHFRGAQVDITSGKFLVTASEPYLIEDGKITAPVKGAAAADAFIGEQETFSVTVRMGEVEKLKEAVSHGLRLRVFLGKKTAISQSSDLTPAIVEKLVDETVEMARLTSEDQSGGLPDPSVFQSEFPDLQLADASWDDLKPRERIEWARRAEAAALQSDRSITNSEGGSFDYARSQTVLANTL